MKTDLIIKIEEAVCRIYQVHPRTLYIKSNTGKSADPRRLCYLLCHEEANIPLRRIAVRYGPRSFQGVDKLIRSARDLIDVDPGFKQRYYTAIHLVYASRPKPIKVKNQLSMAYENEMSI